MKQRRLKIQIVVIVIFICFCCIMVYLDQHNSKSIKVENELKLEFSSIKAPSSAVLKRLDSSRKINQALVQAEYVVDFNTLNIRTYYNEELSKHGWKFTHEESLKEWGKDFGQKEINYQKGVYQLSLSYGGSIEGNTFVINLSWGL